MAQYIKVQGLRGRSRAAARGVTLIELMVGLVIGMIATLVVTQVLAIAESQKRSATSGSDAQVNGALALYTLQRDLQMAGYGLTTTKDVLGCETRAQTGGKDIITSLTPIQITDGANGAPDTITIQSSSKMGPALPTRVVKEHKKTDTEFFVESPVGMNVGDVLIAVPVSIDASNWCSVLNVTGVNSDAGGNHIAHAPGATGPWNTDPAASIFPDNGYSANSYLINAGQIVRREYSVDLATRMLRESIGGTQNGGAMSAATDLYPDIVNLQALYGKDTNKDGVVDQYNTTTPINATGWEQVLVIRVAVAARSGQYEQEQVTAAQPQWDVGGDKNNIDVEGALTCGTSRCITLKVDDLPNWDHYRYKVYEAVVPLRNVLWSQ